MAKDAILGTNLVDSLVPDVIDGIRDSLHPELGVRQFRVFTIIRTYIGAFGGSSFTDLVEELTPQPLVEPYSEKVGESLGYELEPCGLDEAGVVVLKEISLQYTEANIVGPPPSPETQNFYIRISDAQGQAIPDRFFVPVGPPYPDRIKDMGWTLKLKKASTPEGL